MTVRRLGQRLGAWSDQHWNRKRQGAMNQKGSRTGPVCNAQRKTSATPPFTGLSLRPPALALSPSAPLPTAFAASSNGSLPFCQPPPTASLRSCIPALGSLSFQCIPLRKYFCDCRLLFDPLDCSGSRCCTGIRLPDSMTRPDNGGVGPVAPALELFSGFLVRRSFP